MFETIKRVYEKTKNKTLVVNALKKGWITQTEYKQIVKE